MAHFTLRSRRKYANGRRKDKSTTLSFGNIALFLTKAATPDMPCVSTHMQNEPSCFEMKRKLVAFTSIMHLVMEVKKKRIYIIWIDIPGGRFQALLLKHFERMTSCSSHLSGLRKSFYKFNFFFLTLDLC